MGDRVGQTTASEGRSTTWVELLRARALSEPDSPLYTFLRRGAEVESMTVGQLERRARAIGATLQRDASVGDRALLLYPPGLEFAAALFGCFYAGVAAVPAPLPIPDRSLSGIGRLSREAGVSRILSTRRMPEELAHALSTTPAVRGASWLETDAISDADADDWNECTVGANHLSLVTATPFVVGSPGLLRLTHAETLCCVAAIQRDIGERAGDRCISWLPPNVDMGLVAGFLQPLLGRMHSALMSPLEFFRNPLAWLQAIESFGAVVSGGPSFAYELCRAALERERPSLDLSCWRVALIDAPPPSEALTRFSRAAAPLGFRTESIATFASSCQSDACWFGRHGEPAHQDLALVDPATARPPAPGAHAEVWLHTSSLGEGYWEGRRRPARTWPAYRGDTGEGPFFATGEEGAWDGLDLRVGGRAGEAIRLPDGSVEPDALERALEASHPSFDVDAIVVFGLEEDGEESLVVAAELTPAPANRGAQAYARLESVVTIQERVEEFCGARATTVLLSPPGALGIPADRTRRRERCRSRYLAGGLASAERFSSASEPGVS